VPLPRVSPTIGLGRIGCGSGAGCCGWLAIALILGPADQNYHPSDHLGHEHYRADAERGGQPAQLVTVHGRASTHVKREVAMDSGQSNGLLPLPRLKVFGDELGGSG
jgi:hypothetical protein